MRLFPLAAALLLVLPGAAAAQDRSPIPDHWLTLDSLSGILGLTSEQQAGVSDTYAALNGLLQRAVQRREELRLSFQGGPRVSQMNETDRQALLDRLATVRVEYEGRQSELDQQISTLRSLLTADQQARFDALTKPRVLPQPAAQAASAP